MITVLDPGRFDLGIIEASNDSLLAGTDLWVEAIAEVFELPTSRTAMALYTERYNGNDALTLVLDRILGLQLYTLVQSSELVAKKELARI